ncbi:MAG: peptidoglycan DD-metalloendopeptidase family protein [Acidimicrobiia bacterium]|nr:peptidoglycan DD-metalloendopeptidase family protein [Acidimicrobiia bacterium]
MRRFLGSILSLALLLVGVSVTATMPAYGGFCILPPVPGPVVGEYAPIGRYQGHWGVDLAASEGSTVVAPVAGEVTFAGKVAGVLAVTVRHEDGYWVSVSSLQRIDTEQGTVLEAGDAVGRSGRHAGKAAVHVSLRDTDGYRDPEPFLGCARPGRVRLIPVSEA